MKTLKTFTIAFLAIFLAAVPALAQTHPTVTTLASAVSGGAANTIVAVASATGITAGQNSFILVDSELMRVREVSGTNLTVVRAARGVAAGHVSGALVIFGRGSTWNPNTGNTDGVFLSVIPTGSCTRTSQTYLPQFLPVSGGEEAATIDCLGGQWVKGTPVGLDDLPLNSKCNVDIGDVAYTSLGTSEDDVANKRLVTSFWLDRTVRVTGVSVLQGTTATTDNITSGVHDRLGNPIVNTGATGVLLATASTFKQLPFTNNATGATQTTTILTGPHLYFVTVNANGATAEALRAMAASTYNNILSAGTTSVTFGTFAAFTPPTTYTAVLAPFVCLYK